MRGTQTEPNFLIDTRAINAKYARRRHDPRRTWTGVTRVDVAMSEGQKASALREAANRFLQAMHKRRWDIDGRLFLRGPFPDRDDATGAVILGKELYKIVGVFRLADPPKPRRIEIPAGLVQREPDQVISVAEAKKAL